MKQNAFLATILLLLLPTVARASPYILPLQGLRGSTMGGAAIAGGDDHWAAWYNVANIGSRGQKLRAGIDISGIYNAATYLRRDDGQLAASNTLLPKIGVGLAGQAGTSGRLWLALNYLQLYQSNQDYRPAAIAGDTVTSDLGTNSRLLQLSAAIRINEYLTVGLGLQNYFFNYREKTLLADSKHRDYLNPNATVGLTIRAGANWTVGLSYQLPDLFRLGLMYHRENNWAVELAAVYNQGQQTFSLHLGGRYQLTKALELRAGVAYQSCAVTDYELSPGNYDAHKIMLAFGPSYRFDFGLRLDIGYNYYYYLTRQVTTSQVRPLSHPDKSGLPAVGNGNYEYGLHIFGLSLLYEL